jgi:hypothetical protein
VDRMPLVSLLLFLVAVGWASIITAGWIYARRTHRPELARWLGAGLLGGGLLYGGLLLAVSGTSREVVLARGERQRFCGFYLDCHLGFVVREVRVERRGDDDLYQVDLEIVSDARRITMTPGPLDISLLDKAGCRSWRRDATAEAAVTGRPYRESPFDEPLPAGTGYVRTLVFRVPAGVEHPRLSVREGFWVDRLLELVLIGDDDSFLHRRTTMSLI